MNWKVIAIIFISLFILESLFIVWIFGLGNSSIELENECSINVCSDYNYYSYDDYEEICYCYTNDNEIGLTKYLGGI